jgi:glycosyltransferase involved in cell wall biosynthesis
MLLNNFEPPYGGPELQAQKISERMIARDHQVIFIAKGSGKALKEEIVRGIPVFRLNIRGLASVEAYYRLWKLRECFDIIHVHGVGRLASVAIDFAKKFNKTVYIKVTTAGHILKPIDTGPLSFLKRISPFRKRKLAILKQAQGMIAISREIRNELAQHSFPSEKIFSIPNGVDLGRFHPIASEEKRLLRHKLGLPLDKTVIIFTGKITQRKGIDTLVSAWAQAKSIHEKAVLVLVGSGHDQGDSMENWLDQFLEREAIIPSVIRTGAVDNVPEFLMAADCFVFPSKREGLPNSLLEAMASGLLCIASDIGGNRDLVEDGKTGLLLPINDINSWAEAMQQVVSNTPNLYESYSQDAVIMIENNYSLERTVEGLERLYGSDDRKRGLNIC